MTTAITQDAKVLEGARKPWLPRDRNLMWGALLIAALVAAAYLRVLAKLVTDWWQIEDFSYGFLVPPFAAYLLWRKRARLLDTAISPTYFVPSRRCCIAW